MKKTYHRPSNTTQWKISTAIKIPINTEVVEYSIIKPTRTTITRTLLKNKTATVILGHKEGSEIIVTPDDVVFTCVFGSSGHLSTLPEEFIGREVTIIYKQ